MYEMCAHCSCIGALKLDQKWKSICNADEFNAALPIQPITLNTYANCELRMWMTSRIVCLCCVSSHCHMPQTETHRSRSRPNWRAFESKPKQTKLYSIFKLNFSLFISSGNTRREKATREKSGKMFLCWGVSWFHAFIVKFTSSFAMSLCGVSPRELKLSKQRTNQRTRATKSASRE